MGARCPDLLLVTAISACRKTELTARASSEQERQLLEVLPDHDSDAASEFRLLVQKQDGAWDVTLSIAPQDELNTSRGTDSTFNDAWDNMAPLWT
jgi:hypothetical protein